MFQAFSGYLADIHLCYANAITLQDIIQYGLTIFNTIGDDRNTKLNVSKIDKYSFMYDWLIFCNNIGMYYKELPLSFLITWHMI